MNNIFLSLIAGLLLGCGPSIDIHNASQLGKVKIVKQHLNAGKDVNARDGWKRTPLHYAAEEGHRPVVELLIKNGANVNLKDDETDARGETPLHLAAAKGHVPVVELLIKNGANVNAKDADGGTPLHSAAGNGYAHRASDADVRGWKRIVELLLAKGSDINALRTVRGYRTPLDVAIAYQPLTQTMSSGRGIVGLLEKKGAKASYQLETEEK